ncbi:DUF72 domain-containing protein [Flavisphingomonas formosensis]|uniref:DUF72 domain-containing protein n=1 Tax=Flavisphingomonas formosensis TaxID=861534 RepID=UPI0012FC9E6F|nr:DUF72 domain-containing protein [Sphingomonas formosensis]
MTHPVHIGIGGWTYEPWRGTFFPKGLVQSKELEYAAARMTAIEVNGTYYSLQKPDSFQKWADAAPEGFVYTVKASRFATNRRVLAEAGPSIEKFLAQGLTRLGPKLGPILWQFAPTKTFDAEDFGAFLKLLPKTLDGLPLRHALEVRHESFRDAAFVDLAKAHGAAIVHADHATYPEIAEDTADFAYVRLQQAREEEETGYSAAELDAWAEKVREWRKTREIFLFMINGAKVRAPAAAQALIARLS